MSPQMLWLRVVPPTDEEISDSAKSLWESTVDAAPRIGVACGIVLIAIAITFPSVKPVDLLAGLGFFSVAVGFAFQDTLENTLSGVLLLFRQPFRSGDQITVVDRSGTVQGITIRETNLTTFDGELVVIPNRDVYKKVINVHTPNSEHRMEFVVATHARRHDLAKQTAGLRRRARGSTTPPSRPTASAVSATRKVDSSGNVSFAGSYYRAGNAYRRRQVQVAVVGDYVELSIGDEMIQRHQILHDRTREHGALANPGGRPRHINAA